MLHVAAEVRTHLDDLSEVVPDAAQVVDDPRAVADDVAQDLGIGETHDPPMNPVVEAVQAVELVGFEHEIEQARDGHHDDEAGDAPSRRTAQRTQRGRRRRTSSLA